jgi:hypothetical protein
VPLAKPIPFQPATDVRIALYDGDRRVSDWHGFNPDGGVGPIKLLATAYDLRWVIVDDVDVLVELHVFDHRKSVAAGATLDLPGPAFVLH